MDLIGLVKDSFEAVAHEVGAACQRTSSTALADDDRQQEPVRSAAQEGVQIAGGSTISNRPVTGKTDGFGENETVQNDSDCSEIESPVDSGVSKDDSNAESSELSVQPAEFPNQLRLLAEVMQQASQQLSVVATDGLDETDDDPQAIAAAELQTEQTELRKLFESRIHSDEVQALALERLHSELQASRKQLQRSEMAPLFKDIIFCHDFVTRELERDNESTVSGDWRKSFEVLGQMLLDVLFKYDVEPFRSDSAEFDRSMQQCVRSESTTDADQDKQIATCGLIGFRTEERILRREQVTVYRYRPSG